MARTDVITTAKRIRRQLGSGYRNEQGVLAATIADVDNTVAFLVTMPKSVQEGTMLGIDLELMRVLTVSREANTCTVSRGYLDSTAAQHLTNAAIDIAPRFSMLDIVDAMQSEIDSWGADLYHVESQTLTVPTEAQVYELPVEWAEILGVISVKQADTLDAGSYAWPDMSATIIRGENFAGASTSGILLRFLEGIRQGQLFVTVALAFNTSVFLPTTDLVTTLKLSVSLLDVLELGVRRRVIMANDDTKGARGAQDEPRRAEETPMGSMVSLSQLRIGQYMRRRNDEMSRLRRQYPIRML